jgi:hypothetical protein
MKFHSSLLPLVALALPGFPTGVVAADPAAFRWHLEAGPSLWLKTRVTFGANAGADPSAAPKSDRFYDDGFNRVDASGNLGDGSTGPLASRTGYFGFSNDSQVDLKAGTLALHRTQLAGGDYQSATPETKQPAWHAALRVSLHRGAPAGRDWGVEIGVDTVKLHAASAGSRSAALRLLTDTYALGGVVPQRAPYTGRFTSIPGDQRIGDTPARSVSTVAGTLAGTRDFAARSTALQLGPWLEFGQARTQPAATERERWFVRLRGGVALLATRASFRAAEQVQAPGLTGAAPVTASGERRRSDWGAFAGVTLRRAFSPRVSAFGGLEALWGSRMTITQADRYARLDLSKTMLVKFGLEIGLGKR